MADEQELLDLVRPHLKGDETVDDIAQRLKFAAQFQGRQLDDQAALELAQQLVPVDGPPPPPDAPTAETQPPPPPPDAIAEDAPPPEVAMPRLIVDWGDYPQVGHQSRPHFLLLCPEAYQTKKRPKVRVVVDAQLDHEFEVQRPRRLKPDGKGLWGFHVPFRLTSNDKHCLPGQYVIDVAVDYPEVASPQLPHVFHCAIRLRIPQPDANAERTLEIDGDGKSIINLQGQDIKSFSRVVLKGGDNGIINLHNSDLLASPADQDGEEEQTSVTHTFELKPDIHFQGAKPHIPVDFKKKRPSKMETAMFLFEDERRILLIPKKKVAIGRNRGIPIVLRFLPRSIENDRHSLNISRDHMTLELKSEGLLVKDRGPDRHQKQTGALNVADQVVQNGDQHLLARDQMGASILLELPYGLNYDQPFEFDLDLFGGDDDDVLLEETRGRDELTLLRRAVGATRKPPLWRLVEQSGMEAVRLRRRGNLEEEQYVLLYRKALIGSSESSSPICIDDSRLSSQAAQLVYLERSFWLQNLGVPESIQVNGRAINRGEMIPLKEGMELQFGETTVRFEKSQQLHL